MYYFTFTIMRDREMKLLTKNKDMIALVVSADKVEHNVRADYLTAFISAVAGISGVCADSESPLAWDGDRLLDGLKRDGHGNITVLTHLIAKISTRSAYRKKIIAWLEYYCNIHFNTSELKFEYKIVDGMKVKIDRKAWEVLLDLPFWEKLPNSTPDFDYMKEMDRLQKKVDDLIKKSVNAGLEIGDGHNLVTIQNLLNGTIEVDKTEEV